MDKYGVEREGKDWKHTGGIAEFGAIWEMQEGGNGEPRYGEATNRAGGSEIGGMIHVLESGIPKVGGFSSEKTKLEELGELLEFPRLVATAVLKEAMEGTEEMDWVDPVCVLEGSEFYEVRK